MKNNYHECFKIISSLQSGAFESAVDDFRQLIPNFHVVFILWQYDATFIKLTDSFKADGFGVWRYGKPTVGGWRELGSGFAKVHKYDFSFFLYVNGTIAKTFGAFLKAHCDPSVFEVVIHDKVVADRLNIKCPKIQKTKLHIRLNIFQNKITFFVLRVVECN